ncbi:hypothetical protein GCM10009740_02430 [Terrabacter terrae]|uniref:RHS repeat protein n=2 Tax=Terrabacter terrae TaxID=318434 RepID=A0ABP5F6N0_9MICO
MTQASDTGGSRTVTYGYDTVNQHLTSITDTAGGVTTFGWDAAGNLTSIDDPSTTVLNLAYDSARRVTAVEKGPATGTRSVTRFSYPSSTQTQVASPNTDQTQAVSAVPHVTYTLDGTDRVTQAVDELGRTRKTSYTPMADIASATSPAGAVTSAAYGANSGESLTKVTAPTGASASLSYTSGSVNPFAPTGSTDPQGNAAVIGYDGAGNPTSSTNSGTGAVAKVSYRAAGTAGAGTLATSTDPAGKVTSYGIDNATNQITSITPPAGSGPGATALAWDGYGRLQSLTDGRGVTTTYTLQRRRPDRHHRLLRRHAVDQLHLQQLQPGPDPHRRQRHRDLHLQRPRRADRPLRHHRRRLPELGLRPGREPHRGDHHPRHQQLHLRRREPADLDDPARLGHHPVRLQRRRAARRHLVEGQRRPQHVHGAHPHRLRQLGPDLRDLDLPQ